MKDKIKAYLRQVEKEKGVKILHACETGSRAWGFPSPDSDYDVRMVYMHPVNWYLSLYEKKDSINVMYEDREIDVAGWDLKKSLLLMAKSNPPMLERLNSRIVYQSQAGFQSEMQELAKLLYSRIATNYHYFGVVKRGWEDVNQGDEFKLKRFFYTLRSVLVCQWVVEREDVPPIELSRIMDGVELSESIKVQIEELVALKATKSEAYLHKGESELFKLISKTMGKVEKYAQGLPTGQKNYDLIDEFFRKQLMKHDH